MKFNSILADILLHIPSPNPPKLSAVLTQRNACRTRPVALNIAVETA